MRDRYGTVCTNECISLLVYEGIISFLLCYGTMGLRDYEIMRLRSSTIPEYKL